MKILALESSAKAASVCLTEDGVAVAQYFQNSGLTHSRTLLKMAEDMLTNLDISVKDLDVIACAAGPGSFTGIRIGVAAAKGLAWGADLKLCGVSTLEAMAYCLTDREGSLICPVMDARRGQIYNALFTIQNGEVKRVCPDRAISLNRLIDDIKVCGNTPVLIGDGAKLCAAELEKEGIGYLLPSPQLIMQTAFGVAAAAEKHEPQDDISPNYLRLSQAERERLARGEKI